MYIIRYLRMPSYRCGSVFISIDKIIKTQVMLHKVLGKNFDAKKKKKKVYCFSGVNICV